MLDLLSEALAKDGPFSLASLANLIGLPNKAALVQGLPRSPKGLVAKNRRHRLERTAAIEGALRSALSEAPVPSLTDIARRLGLRTMTALTRRFPDLSAQLKQRRQASTEQLTASFTQIPPANPPLAAAISVR